MNHKGQDIHQHSLRWIIRPLEQDDHPVYSNYNSSMREVKPSTQSSLSTEYPTDTTLAEHNRTSPPHIAFRHHVESMPSELFYDLFFVANLVAFTQIREIQNIQSLASYIEFFCLLWFTWFSVCLYDVRFGIDSILERIAKACQLGVMVGFAVIAVFFEASVESAKSSMFYQHEAQPLSLILMASRLILVFQYLTAAWFSRHDRRVSLVLGFIGMIYLSSAAIYLGISFAFIDGHLDSSAYIGWLVTAVAETVLNLLVSSFSKRLDFNDTHLVQRMSLLTLIILGEGAIGLYQSAQTAWKETFGLAPFVGAVVSALLILYFLYMLYFDNLPKGHFGKIREQAWASFHFPLHLALVVFIEGGRQFITWIIALEVQQFLLHQLENIDAFEIVFWSKQPTLSFTNTTEYFEATFQNFTNLSQYVLVNYVDGMGPDTNSSITSNLNAIKYGMQLSAYNYATNIIEIVIQLFTVVFGAYRIAHPEVPKTAGTTATLEELFAVAISFLSLYDMVYVYFFVAAGLALIFIGFMVIISKRTFYRFDWVRTGALFAVGLTLAMLALMDLSAQNRENPGGNFLSSPWILPTAMLSLGVALLIHHLPF